MCDIMSIILEDSELKDLGLTKKAIKNLTKIDTKKDDAKLEANIASVNKLAEAISQLAKKPEAVQQDLAPVQALLSSTFAAQKNIIELLSAPKRLQEWEFTIVRSESGSIKKIKAKEIK